jgi:hypothetical protein
MRLPKAGRARQISGDFAISKWRLQMASSCRTLLPAAALDLTGIEACRNGIFAPRDQGFARRVSLL